MRRHGTVARAVAARGIMALAAFLLYVAPAFGDQYALVVTGASGGDAYAQKYDRWRVALVSTLR